MQNSASFCKYDSQKSFIVWIFYKHRPLPNLMPAKYSNWACKDKKRDNESCRVLKKHEPRPLTGPEAAVTSALPPLHHHPHFLETSETKSLPPAAHFIGSLRKMLVKDLTVALKSYSVPSDCGSSGFRSKRPPDSCWVSAWPSPCTQTAPGSSSRQGRDWWGSCPGESGPPNILTKLVRTFQINTFTVSSLKAVLVVESTDSEMWDQ